MASKLKRPSFKNLENTLPEQPTTFAVTLSRDNVVTLPEPVPEEAPARDKSVKATEPRTVAGPRRRSPNDNTRHTYHASLYLPDEAQFALREIALTMRKAKPHDVMLEAMAELFEKYNKGAVAKACRARITSRDKAVT